MTALDQAFIKAFSQQDAPAVAVAPRPAARTSSRPLPSEANLGEETRPRREEQAAAEKATTSAMFDRFDGILAALEKMPNLQTEPAGADRAAGIEKAEHGWNDFSSIEIGSGQWVGGGAEWIVEDEALGSNRKTLVLGPEPQPSIPEPQTAAPEPLFPKLVYRPSNHQPGIPFAGVETQNPVAQISNLSSQISNLKPQPRGTETQILEHEPQTLAQEHWPLDEECRITSPEPPPPSPEPSRFQPAWQVERFNWPRVCRRLISRAGDEWERLADALLSAGNQGRKVLAFAGCRRGEGTTTLLLCAAHKLAERGVKTAMVDADLSRPRLAKRLGVQPQLGWNDAAGESPFSIDQAVIETAGGNLALLAVGESAENNAAAAANWTQWTACLEQLRSHYDLVLVDLGPLNNSVPAGGEPSWISEKIIDSLLFVHNRRVTAEEDLHEMQQRLAEAGVNPAGLIENFVA